MKMSVAVALDFNLNFHWSKFLAFLIQNLIQNKTKKKKPVLLNNYKSIRVFTTVLLLQNIISLFYFIFFFLKKKLHGVNIYSSTFLDATIWDVFL